MSTSIGGLFYAYAAAPTSNTSEPEPYLLIFPSPKFADTWWRAITDSVESGYPRFAAIQRHSPQFYTHEPASGAHIKDTVRDRRCAKEFDGKIIFKQLGEQPAILPPIINYVECLNGSSYYIRSCTKRDQYWYSVPSVRLVSLSSSRRSLFTIRIANPTKAQGVVILDDDEVTISYQKNSMVSMLITKDQSMGHLRCDGRNPDSILNFRFSEFKNGLFSVHDGSQARVTIAFPSSTEEWELVSYEERS